MPRRTRYAPGGLIYHVLNRAAGRRTLFRKDDDYAAFERILAEMVQRYDARLLAYCLMPNHWHLALWPRRDGELSDSVRWLSVTHAQRLHAHRHTAGTGPIYQGRFKSFPMQDELHLQTVCRYVERNPLRAGLVRRAEAWRWSSLGVEHHRARGPDVPTLSAWPRPRSWVRLVNEPQTDAELQSLRRCVHRGSPLGDASWAIKIAKKLGLQSTLRPPGRPKKEPQT